MYTHEGTEPIKTVILQGKTTLVADASCQVVKVITCRWVCMCVYIYRRYFGGSQPLAGASHVRPRSWAACKWRSCPKIPSLSGALSNEKPRGRRICRQSRDNVCSSDWEEFHSLPSKDSPRVPITKSVRVCAESGCMCLGEDACVRPQLISLVF